jgi:hypothetical protein
LVGQSSVQFLDKLLSFSLQNTNVATGRKKRNATGNATGAPVKSRESRLWFPTPENCGRLGYRMVLGAGVD